MFRRIQAIERGKDASMMNKIYEFEVELIVIVYNRVWLVSVEAAGENQSFQCSHPPEREIRSKLQRFTSLRDAAEIAMDGLVG